MHVVPPLPSDDIEKVGWIVSYTPPLFPVSSGAYLSHSKQETHAPSILGKNTTAVSSLCQANLLLLSPKYCGFFSLQFGQGLFLPYFSRHSLQSSFPHFSCCLGSSATSRHMPHTRALSGSASKLNLLALLFAAILLTLNTADHVVCRWHALIWYCIKHD